MCVAANPLTRLVVYPNHFFTERVTIMQSAQARLLLIDDNLADLRVLTEIIATRHG